MKVKTASLLGLVVIMAMAGCAAAPGAQSTQTATSTSTKVTVTKGTVQTTIIATGNIVAPRVADVVWQQSGQVTEVDIKAGDMVKQGQPLAKLDDTSLKLTERQQYANYVSAQASYSQTVSPSPSAIASAKAALMAAQTNYSATVQGATPSDIASARAALASASASYSDLLKPPDPNSVANLKAALDNAKAALDQAQASYDTAFQRNPAGIGGSAAALSLQQATNNYIAAKANYDQAFKPATASALANAQSQIVAAQAKLASLTPTAQAIAQAQSSLASAQASVDNLTPTPETIAQAQAKVDQAYYAWQQAQQNVQNATLTSPFDGMVMVVTFQAGDWAGGGQSAIQVADIAKPLFEVAVDETDMGSVKVGEPAIVQLGAYPGVAISATVDTIYPEGTNAGSSVTFKVDLILGGVMRGTGAGTGGSQTRQGGQTGARQAVTGTVPNQGGQGGANATGTFTRTAQFAAPVILLGMSGTSQVVTAQASNSLVVPNGALTVDRTTRGYTVQRVDANGQVTIVPVTVGLRGTSDSQVITGLNDGDVILVPRTATTPSTGGGGGPGGFGGAIRIGG